MGNDNGDVRNNVPPLGIMDLKSFYSHFVNCFLWHNFYTRLYFFICPRCFLILTFVCSWFGLLFANCLTLFVALKGRKKCWPFNFLFQDGANVVAYLNTDNHKTRRIWHYFSYLKNFLLRFFLKNDFIIMEFSFHDSWRNQFKWFDNLMTTRFNLF
jgi:hypothetical protein